MEKIKHGKGKSLRWGSASTSYRDCSRWGPLWQGVMWAGNQESQPNGNGVGRRSRQWGQQVQRPWGRSMLGMGANLPVWSGKSRAGGAGAEWVGQIGQDGQRGNGWGALEILSGLVLRMRWKFIKKRNAIFQFKFSKDCAYVPVLGK